MLPEMAPFLSQADHNLLAPVRVRALAKDLIPNLTPTDSILYSSNKFAILLHYGEALIIVSISIAIAPLSLLVKLAKVSSVANLTTNSAESFY